MKSNREFPERYGGWVLLVCGVVAWLGAVGATVADHDPVAVAAIPVGAALIGAAAYYSRVRKFAGVELVDAVLEEGSAYQPPPDATPTEAVQGFALTLADQLAEDSARRPYFVHVDQTIPRGMVARATWEATEAFAGYLEEEGWEVEREVRLGATSVDMIANRDKEQLWVEVKGVVYALNPSVIREIAEQFPPPSLAPRGVKVRRALFLPTPPLVISPEALADMGENQLELWYADAKAPKGFVKAA